MAKIYVFIIAVSVSLISLSSVHGQPPRGGGGPGGPGQTSVKIVDEFDVDKNGYLDVAERKKARESLKQQGNERPRRRPRGNQNRATGKPGPEVSVTDVKNYPDADLYDEGVLRTLFLEFEADDWESELADFKPTDVEVLAKLVVDGKEYPDVGVRFRGASSFFMIPEGLKRSFNVSMDVVDDKQRLYGYKTLNLLNGNGDASFMSSYLYSHIANQEIPAPKVNFVKVVVNGRSWGVYINAQQFNKEFVKDFYDTKKGARWKVKGNPRGDAGLRYIGDDVEEYRERYTIKSKDKEESWADLINLCKVLEETPIDDLPEALEPILDVDGALWFLAVDVATANSDGYWTRASDYSIYQDTDSKFHLIPHDMNESFRESTGRPGGGGPGGRGGRGRGGRGGQQQEGGQRRGGQRQGGAATQQTSRGARLDPLVNLGEERFQLRNKLLQVPEWKNKYLVYVETIARVHLDWENLGGRIEKATALIGDEIQQDTRKLSTWEAFQKATSSSGDEPTSGSLQAFAKNRREFLMNHPEIKKAIERSSK